MDYIVAAGKYLSEDDKLNFSERIENYLRQGRYKFKEHLAQDPTAISLFSKYVLELINIMPSNVYAYTSNDEWIIIFSQTSLEKKFKDVKGKLYIRAKEVKEEIGEFLEILSIKETTDVFHIDFSILKLPEKYTYPQTMQFNNWNFIASAWQNKYFKEVKYTALIPLSPPPVITDVKIPPLEEEVLKENLSNFKIPLIFYFNEEIGGAETATFINSAPLNLVNLLFFEKTSWNEKGEHLLPNIKTCTQIEVVIQYKPECMLLP